MRIFFNQMMLKWFPKKEDPFSIEIFQLENLISNRIPFLFFNLNSSFSAKNEEGFISSIMKVSQSITPLEVKEKLKNTDKAEPIILICETGSQSATLVQRLQKEGFINTFFIKGGIISLMKEGQKS